MKTLRKYMAMAFLLISATAIIPTFGSLAINEQEKIKSEETAVEPKKTAWYNKEIKNENGEIIGTFAEIAGVISFLASASALVWYTGIWKVLLPAEEPCYICKNNELHREIAKICSKYGVENYRFIS